MIYVYITSHLNLVCHGCLIATQPSNFPRVLRLGVVQLTNQPMGGLLGISCALMGANEVWDELLYRSFILHVYICIFIIYIYIYIMCKYYIYTMFI